MQYEITFITKDEKDTKIVKDLLKSEKVKIVHEDEMGRKNFAYPIKKESAGFYWTYYVEAEPNVISKISNELNTYKEILRFLILSFKLDITKIKKMGSKRSSRNLKDVIEKQTPKEVVLEKAVEKKEKTTPKKSETGKKTVKTKKEAKTIKRSVKTLKTVKKDTAKPEEKDKKTEEKSSDDQERIKKLEEKLDELLKD